MKSWVAKRENYSCSFLCHDWKILAQGNAVPFNDGTFMENIAQDKICLRCGKEVKDWSAWIFQEKDTSELARLRKTSIEQTKSRSLFP